MVLQMVGMVFILRVSRTQKVEGPRYLNTTAICLAEVVKLIASLAIHFLTSDDMTMCLSGLRVSRREWLTTSVPSLLYALQNNLLFIGISNVSAGTYQVTYQLKILTTAGISFLMLGKRFTAEKWFALFLLTAGVALVNISGGQEIAIGSDSNAFLKGLAAILGACLTSGFAGVYLEKILQDGTASIWVRNIQLALFGSCFAFWIAIQSDGEKIYKDGFLQGYTPLIWGVVAWQALGGLIVAAVMKYADNMLKCFGCALAIILTCLLSAYVLMEFKPDRSFISGTFLVLLATAIYNLGFFSQPSPLQECKTPEAGDSKPVLPLTVSELRPMPV